jgi:hypothetical protein
MQPAFAHAAFYSWPLIWQAYQHLNNRLHYVEAFNRLHAVGTCFALNRVGSKLTWRCDIIIKNQIY